MCHKTSAGIPIKSWAERAHAQGGMQLVCLVHLAMYGYTVAQNSTLCQEGSMCEAAQRLGTEGFLTVKQSQSHEWQDVQVTCILPQRFGAMICTTL